MAPQPHFRPTSPALGLGVLVWLLIVRATGIVQVWGTGPAVNGIRVRWVWAAARVLLLLVLSMAVIVAVEFVWRARRASRLDAQLPNDR